jgi:hypothetical protein
MERNYTDLEKALIQFGFTELFGIGLFAVSENSIVADSNTGMVKLSPCIDAPSDDFIEFYEEGEAEKLKAKLQVLKKTDFIY